jgi:SpoVK/Ycf46/Vps4 family AAA+-type ATPase
MDPKDLVDEAFLRRIPHKIFVGDPSPEEFREIFRRMCEIKKIPYDERALVYLMQEHYVKAKRKLRAVHPRDILSHVEDLAAYTGVEPRLTKDLLDHAATAYFVDL